MKIDSNGGNNTLLYHDNNALSSIKFDADKEQALETVAGQFEAMFLQMVLRQMRSSSDVLAPEDNPFSSKEQGVYRDFYDGQLAMELAKKQRSGIADMLIKQLSPNHEGAVDSEIMAANEAAAEPKLIRQKSGVEADMVNAVRPLNEPSDLAAYDKRESFKDTYQEAMSTVAFQQPLNRKMEL
ncbi:rod-binding protein [Photobacterium sp.]|uniref:rod-binding protein n=1 Tax=Photobacterium sp. TaxID=660 RepID=UPI00299DBFA9|nr:rod-binding protein [Photobacterium sp.]MDX1301092.1 rod-binding protein [Photobacterium sp.]